MKHRHFVDDHDNNWPNEKMLWVRLGVCVAVGLAIAIGLWIGGVMLVNEIMEK